MCLYVLFHLSSTYIALQPLGVFDLSSTSSTYIALQPLGVLDLSPTHALIYTVFDGMVGKP